jgi:cytochrome c-type biogenesis protein CcmH
MDRLTRITRLTAVALIVLIAALGVVAVASAQDGGGETPPPDGETVTDDEVNAIAEQLYCPVCENVPLDVCGTKACADWRDEIRTMLEEGRSEDEIKAYFSDRYGRRVLATPERTGIDLLVWILPPVGVLIGAAVLVLALRRMAPTSLKAQPAAGGITYDDLDPEYVARIERDLEDFAG